MNQVQAIGNLIDPRREQIPQSYGTDLKLTPILYSSGDYYGLANNLDEIRKFKLEKGHAPGLKEGMNYQPRYDTTPQIDHELVNRTYATKSRAYDAAATRPASSANKLLNEFRATSLGVRTYSEGLARNAEFTSGAEYEPAITTSGFNMYKQNIADHLELIPQFAAERGGLFTVDEKAVNPATNSYNFGYMPIRTEANIRPYPLDCYSQKNHSRSVSPQYMGHMTHNPSYGAYSGCGCSTSHCHCKQANEPRNPSPRLRHHHHHLVLGQPEDANRCLGTLTNFHR